jgi:cell division protein DivIC
MPVHRDNILTFQRPHGAGAKAENKEIRPRLHPSVRRRRLFWLATMIVVVVYTVYGWITQQNRIWEKERQLAAKKAELQKVQAETKKLEEEIWKLRHDENYLLELAHSMGYGKPGEEIYAVPEK